MHQIQQVEKKKTLEEHLGDFNSEEFLCWLQNKLRNPDDAREMYQDVFRRATKNFETFRGECKFSTWIYRIANNAIIDLYRKRRNKPEVLLGDIREQGDGDNITENWYLGEMATENRAGDLLAAQDIADLVRKTMGVLTDHQANIVNLHLQGIGGKEAARRGLVNTANIFDANLARAIIKMRERLRVLEVEKGDYL